MIPESSTRTPNQSFLWHRKVPLTNPTNLFYDTGKFHSQTQRSFSMTPESSTRTPSDPSLWHRKVPLAHPAIFLYDTGKFHSHTQPVVSMISESSTRKPSDPSLWYRKVSLLNPVPNHSAIARMRGKQNHFRWNVLQEKTVMWCSMGFSN